MHTVSWPYRAVEEKRPTVLVASPSKELPHHKALFVVIDDAGLSVSEVDRFLNLPMPMTIAVLPHLKESERVAAAIHAATSKELILHQPMEAYRGKSAGRGTISEQMSEVEVLKVLQQNIASVPGVLGMNNHMGSAATESEALMDVVLRFCNQHGLYFLDSKTAFNSMVPRVGKRLNMHVEQRDAFLDIKHDRQSIQRAWQSAIQRSNSQSAVIVIGHVWSKSTAAVLGESYQSLLDQGYSFHLLSELYE